jgi:hypothetical protein
MHADRPVCCPTCGRSSPADGTNPIPKVLSQGHRRAARTLLIVGAVFLALPWLSPSAVSPLWRLRAEVVAGVARPAYLEDFKRTVVQQFVNSSSVILGVTSVAVGLVCWLRRHRPDSQNEPNPA